jgi:N-acetylmuramoyl-L-alanine amidase
MIDPAGDQTNPGRLIKDQYERTIATKYAQTIKQELEKRASKLLILFSRLPGQQAQQIEKAQCANQLNIDLFIRLQIYETGKLKPQMHLFYYKTESWNPPERRAFTPFEKAHLANITKTEHFARHLKKGLSDKMLDRYYDLHEPIGFPYRPLKGISAPALCIEIGLKNPDQWSDCVEPIAESLEKICLHLNDM